MSKVLLSSDNVVVVGAGLAGWKFSEALRQAGFAGGIEVIGSEEQSPYDRPPLTKQILTGKWPLERSELASGDRLAELDISFHSNATAESLDLATSTVTCEDGREFSGDRVVIATGSRSRRLPFSAGDLLHTVRTVSDVAALLADLASRPKDVRVAIVGGGFVGAEVATSLKSLGYEPVVLEASVHPLVNIVGHDVAQWLASLASDFGIELRTQQTITDVVVSGSGFNIVFANGTTEHFGVIVEAAGAMPNTEWLESSGLEIDNGVKVNEYLMATPTVGAIGDVAHFTWHHQPFVDSVRIEHWQTATDHALALAATMIRGEAATGPLSMVPYFWSDQYGKKIQMLGHPASSDEVVRVTGSIEEGKWLALYAREGVVTGLLSLNQPRALMLSRELVASHMNLDDALERAPWTA